MAAHNDFRKLIAQMPNKAEGVLDSYQAFWVDGAKQLAPVDTGDLKDSIAPAPGATANERRVVATMDYAIHQEFGTIHQPGTPFMRESRQALVGAFKRDIKAIFEP